MTNQRDLQAETGVRPSKGPRAGEGEELAGLTILVTRPAEQASKLTMALQGEGAEVVELPSIQIEPPASWGRMDEAIHRGGCAWVVFTSANGVRFFFERLRSHHLDASWFDGSRVAAIGPETARAIEAEGVRPSLVPDEFVAEALVASLAEIPLEGQHVLLPRADIARDALADGLEAQGAIVDRVIAYRTVTPSAPPEVLDRLRRGDVDVASFTSSSTVRNLVAMLGPDQETLRRLTIACIGPVTAATARDLGLEPSIVATTYTIPGLVAAIRSYYWERKRPGKDVAG